MLQVGALATGVWSHWAGLVSGLVSGLVWFQVWFDFLYDLNFTALKFDWTFQIERCGDLWMWVSKVDLTLDRIPILERELLGLM